MPINQINAPSQGSAQKTPDVLDRIAQGLTIANQGLGVAVNFETLNKTKLENQALQDANNNTYRAMDFAKSNMNFTPNAPAVPPQGDKPATKLDAKPINPDDVPGWHAPLALPTSETPVDRAAKKRFAKQTSYPVKMRDGEKIVEGTMTSKDAEDKLIGQEGELRKEFSNQPQVQIADQAAINFENANKFLSKGTKEGDITGMINVMKIINPNVARAPDGSVLNVGDTLPEQWKKKLAALLGDNNTILLPDERKQLMIIAADAARNAYSNAAPTQARYKTIAEQGGFLPENVGIRDYSQGFGVPKEPEPRQSAPTDPNTKHIPGVGTFKKGADGLWNQVGK